MKNKLPAVQNKIHYQPFKERLTESCGCRFLAHDDWSELTMITDQDYLLGTKNHRNHALRLRRLKYH
jgi:hypothetical protein